MTAHKHTYAALLLAAALGMFVAGAFLLPRGETLSHLSFIATLGFMCVSLCAYAYALRQDSLVLDTDATLRPEIDWHVARGDTVPGSLLEGAAPLIALVQDGQVPHPDMASMLVPYFADPAVAFVQGATRFDGDSAVAEAFRLQQTIHGEFEHARGALNAVSLEGSGALISREALRAAWRPGDTWPTLGLRLQAEGYVGRYEAQPVVLAWGPATLEEYGRLLAERTRRVFSTAWAAMRIWNLPLETRLQYLAAAAAPAAAWSGGAAFLLGTLSLIVRNAGPAIVTSHAALLGVLTLALSVAAAGYAFVTLTSVNPARPAALALGGVGAMAIAWTQQAIRSQPAQRAWSFVVGAARATARASGSGDTVPAGTPARL